MRKTICLYNHAGGVGKTTGASVIACLLASRGYRTLAVDMDPQSNLTQFLSANTPGVTIEQALRGGAMPLIDLQPYLQLAPASPGLIAAEDELRRGRNNFALQNILSTIQDGYDFIVIDSPPSTNYLAINALTAADYLLVPVLPDGKSLAGLDQVRIACKTASTHTAIDGIFLSCFNKRRTLDLFIESELLKYYGNTVYKAHIRQCIALPECALQGIDILSYSPHSNAAKDYAALVDELLSRVSL